MRVTTAFKRMLRLPGASVIDVSFGAEGVIVTIRLRRRRRVCSRCGQTGRFLEIHDRRVKRWRHLDVGANRCVIECCLRRLRCPDCGVHLEAVPWARPDAHHTRDFEDVVAWLAQQMAKTPIAGLLRIGWDTVGKIVEPTPPPCRRSSSCSASAATRSAQSRSTCPAATSKRFERTSPTPRSALTPSCATRRYRFVWGARPHRRAVAAARRS